MAKLFDCIRCLEDEPKKAFPSTDVSMSARCCKCGEYLAYDFERDEDLCGECQDRAIEKWQRMADWHEFHGDYHDEQAEKAELPRGV